MNRSYRRRNPRFLGGVRLTMGVDRYDNYVIREEFTSFRWVGVASGWLGLERREGGGKKGQYFMLR